MIKQHPAQMYLASARKLLQTGAGQCFSIFDSQKIAENSQKSFGNLMLFNYQILAPEQKTTLHLEAANLYYIIPLYGAIQLQGREILSTQKTKQIATSTPLEMELSNPFAQNISFLLIGFKSTTNFIQTETLTFSFEENNKLIYLFENQITTAFIGQFAGRKEGEYHLKHKENGIFVYIIQGAFEFENRLLETGDALSIQEIESVAWEALSENAMLLLIEIF